MIKKISFIFFSVIFSFCFFVQFGLASVNGDNVIINEVQIDSIDGTGGTYDDWVELYNPTGNDIDLGGWSIQKTNDSFGSLYRVELSGIIPANGYFLIVRDHTNSSSTLKSLADLLAPGSVASFSLSSNNSVYLVDNNEDISTSSDENIVDMLGFGTSNIFEGNTAALNPEGGSSIERTLFLDTDQNGDDFILQSNPSPHNSSFNPDQGGNLIPGIVALTITYDANTGISTSSDGAVISFQTNATGTAYLDYGLDNSYGDTVSTSTYPNASTTDYTIIELSNLSCDTEYHYRIRLVVGASSTETSDLSFRTASCASEESITINSISMTRSVATADNSYANGWEWVFDIEISNKTENAFRMKFSDLNNTQSTINASNIRFSLDGGGNWNSILAANIYSSILDISSIDLSSDPNKRGLEILVQVKVPIGTMMGDNFVGTYSIRVE